MPDSWEYALDKYKYPVDLSKFVDASEYRGWFKHNTETGKRCDTIVFESNFRENARRNLEAWYEVVFWKMYSQTRLRNGSTQDVICRIKDSGVTAEGLRDLCMKYIDKPSRASFVQFKDKIHKARSPMLATAATFPAFICPDKFPMVDSQITKWAKRHGALHVGAPDISIARKWKNDDVRIHMWPFIESWIDWCQFTAKLLTERTERDWRARDVEMAVWTAQKHNLKLNPLCD